VSSAPQVGQQGEVGLGQLLAPTTRPADPARTSFLAGRTSQFVQPTVNRTARQPGDPCQRQHTTPTRGPCLGRRETPPTALVQNWGKRCVA
jgi:hypothetical protein